MPLGQERANLRNRHRRHNPQYRLANRASLRAIVFFHKDRELYGLSVRVDAFASSIFLPRPHHRPILNLDY